MFSQANLSPSCYRLLIPGNLQSALTEGDHRCLPVTPYQSKRLTSLGVARWQTVVLLLSMLRMIMVTENLSSWFPVFVLIVLLVVAAIFVAIHTDGRSKVSFHFQSCLLANTVLNWLFISLVEPDSFYYTRLFLNCALRIDCSNLIAH